MSRTSKADLERLHQLEVRRWESERLARVDKLAAVLTHLNAALAAFPSAGYADLIDTTARTVATVRVDMRIVMAKKNPLTKEPTP